MALFSRRPKKIADDVPTPQPSPQNAPVEPEPEVVPEVSVSMTTFGQPSKPASLDEPAPAQPAARARRATPGAAENTLLADALAAFEPESTPLQRLNVARQLLQGQLYLRVRGDARALLAAGEQLPLTVATSGDDQYLLAYTGGAPLEDAVRADGDTATSAVAVPFAQVMRQAIDGPFAGLSLDHASAPATTILPRSLLERSLVDLDEQATVKSALIGQRTPEVITALVAALESAPLWLAARTNDDGAVGVAEMRTPEGTRMLELYSHPLELHALGRGDSAVKITSEQLGKALAGDPELAGVVVNPHGPWMSLSREELAPIIALAGD